MRAGELDHFVQVQESQKVKGSVGGTTLQWVDVGDPVYAGISDIRGGLRDQVAQGGSVGTASTGIKMRYRPDVKAQMRVVHESQIYTILFVNDFKRAKSLLILSCEAVVTP